MKAQDLKKSILQLAIQGKLVDQDPNDEPATVLLERIKAEKAALVKAGKIKKDKVTSFIYKTSDGYFHENINGVDKDISDELPFDIPDSWMWVRLKNILNLLTDGTHKTPHYIAQGVPFISVKDISSGFISFDNTKFISEEEANELNLRCNPEKGDLLLSKVGTTGIPAPVDTDIKFSLFVSVALLKFSKIFLSREYLIYAILSPCIQIQCAESTKGVGNKNWVMRDISNTLLPLPPQAEQKRIVAKIEELEPLIAEYDTAETALTALNTVFPKQMKKSILQLAIQGKLVEQDPNDESATVLLERIKAEKAALVKAGKIKKDKPLPPITEDEIPFDIPDSWMWVRLGDISNYSSPKKKISPNQITSEMWSLDLEDIEKGTGRIIEKHFAKDRAIQGEKVCFEKGNILYSKLRPYLLKILIAEDNGITSPELIPFNIYGDSYQPFFLWYLRSPYVDSIVNSASYGVKMPRVGTETMIQLLVPLPPLAEQKRIVAKIEELMLLNFI